MWRLRWRGAGLILATDAGMRARDTGAQVELGFDSRDLTRMSGFDPRKASGHERQQVFQTIRFRAENNNCDLAGS